MASIELIGGLVITLFVSAGILVLVSNVYFHRLLRHLKDEDRATWERLTGYQVFGTKITGGRTGTKGIKFVFQESHPGDEFIADTKRRLRPIYKAILLLTVLCIMIAISVCIFAACHL